MIEWIATALPRTIFMAAVVHLSSINGLTDEDALMASDALVVS